MADNQFQEDLKKAQTLFAKANARLTKDIMNQNFTKMKVAIVC